MFMSNKIKESDLNPTAKQFLRDQGCTELYGEILDIDLVGVNGNLIYAIELKTTLSIKVLEQALNRKAYANYVYVAVPHDKLAKHYDLISPVFRLFLETHGIGLIGLYAENRNDKYIQNHYEIYKHAKINRHNKGKGYLKKYFNDMYKDMDGGMTSAERISPYTLMTDEVLERLNDIRYGATMYSHLKRDGWVTIDELLVICRRPQKHYANPKASLGQIFNRFWISIVEKKKVNNKVYYRIKEQIND